MATDPDAKVHDVRTLPPRIRAVRYNGANIMEVVALTAGLTTGGSTVYSNCMHLNLNGHTQPQCVNIGEWVVRHDRSDALEFLPHHLFASKYERVNG